MARDLLPLQQATERLQPFRRRYLGVRAIDVRKVIGTDSRGNDFDRDFRALRGDVRERRRRVAHAFPNGDFPPIVVEKVGDAYADGSPQRESSSAEPSPSAGPELPKSANAPATCLIGK